MPRQPHEPLVNVPWPILSLLAVLLGAHAIRGFLHIDAQLLAFSSGDLAAGRWWGLLTYMLAHGSWTHVLFNCLSILVFGPPVVRFMGAGARGGLAFYVYFLVCGFAAALGYAAIHPNGNWALVGASGAAFGLVGGATRLIEGRGEVGSLFGRTVLGMTAFAVVGNAVMGIFGLTPGAGSAPVAWEAHVFGYFAGLFLIGPSAWLAGTASHDAITH